MIQIKKVGITNVGTDCIVNAANEGLWEGGGVCGVIFKAAGSAQLTKACKAIGGCKTGSAVITPAFNLNAKYIIHAVGPVWKGGANKEPQQLYGCYKKSLELAKEHGCHSVGFPLISAGIFGYPLDKAWRKAIQACNDFLHANPDYKMDIVFAVIDDSILNLGVQTLNEICGDSNDIVVLDKVTSNDLDEMIDRTLLLSISRAKLEAGILLFCQMHCGFADHKGAMSYINLLDPDFNYQENYEKYCKGISPTDMNVKQIQTFLTYIQRADHFGFDYLTKYINDGTILKCLLRLDDLIKKLDDE